MPDAVAHSLGLAKYAHSSNIFAAHEFTPDAEHADEWEALHTACQMRAYVDADRAARGVPSEALSAATAAQPVGVPAGWKFQPDEEGMRVVSPSGDVCYLWDLDSRHEEAGQGHREVLRQLCQDLLFGARGRQVPETSLPHFMLNAINAFAAEREEESK